MMTIDTFLSSGSGHAGAQDIEFRFSEPGVAAVACCFTDLTGDEILDRIAGYCAAVTGKERNGAQPGRTSA